jgi:Dynamin family
MTTGSSSTQPGVIARIPEGGAPSEAQPSDPPPLSYREIAVRLAEHGVKAATAYDRPDLADRLRSLTDRVLDPTVRVLVVGEFKQGKSSLVNAIVGQPVCPVDDDIATAVPTAVRFAEQPVAMAVVRQDDDELRRQPVAVATLPAWVTETGVEVAKHDVELVEVGVTSDVLRDGLVLVDLPGVGGLGSLPGAVTMAALPYARAVVFVSDAAQELTAPELDFIRGLARQCHLIALVDSKIDIHPAWRRVVDADSADIAGLTLGPFAVSSELAAKAAESEDRVLAMESGLGPVVEWLRDDVLDGAARRDALLMAEVVGAVADQLADPLEAERSALADPEGVAALVTQLEGAQGEVVRLRTVAGRWQQALVDAFADLSGDLDHDLRARVRDVVNAADHTADDMDPAKGWSEYEPQLRREVAGLVGDHYQILDERITSATQAVAAVFTEDADSIQATVREAVGGVSSDLPAQSLDSDRPLTAAKRAGLGTQALTLVRSSYGGAVMLGFLGATIGFPVVAPAALGVGLLLGAHGLRQESGRQLLQRRAQVKAAVRSYVDEISFSVGKDSRDRIRFSQRHLRDFFAARAAELNESAMASLQAVQDATGRAATDREGRQRDVAAELERIAWLARTAADVRTALEERTGQ